MINILVSFDNADFINTQFNGTLEDAKQYYNGNYFTISDETKVQAVAVHGFSEWKIKVLNFCMENNNKVLKFDDEMKVLYFMCSRNHKHICTYDDVNKNIEAPTGWTFGNLYGNGWVNPIFETKENAIEEAKKHFKSSIDRFIEVGWCIYKNNQLNVINCERIEF